MSAPLVRPHITYEDLCDLPSDGNRWELIDGEAYMTPAPNRMHQEILQRLFEAFRAATEDGSKVYLAPLDVVLAEATVLQPDLIFVREENREILQEQIRGVPDLVAEVLSPGTVKMDRGAKMEIYARHGVPEYWIVDPEAQSIEIYRLDREVRRYRHEGTHGAGDRATTPLLPALSVDPADLFAD
jgi:Uma2 family endonuclease